MVTNLTEPDWAEAGVEVVAANSDGTVEAAFVVQSTGSYVVERAPHGILYQTFEDR